MYILVTSTNKMYWRQIFTDKPVPWRLGDTSPNISTYMHLCIPCNNLFRILIGYMRIPWQAFRLLITSRSFGIRKIRLYSKEEISYPSILCRRSQLRPFASLWSVRLENLIISSTIGQDDSRSLRFSCTKLLVRTRDDEESFDSRKNVSLPSAWIAIDGHGAVRLMLCGHRKGSRIVRWSFLVKPKGRDSAVLLSRY